MAMGAAAGPAPAGGASPAVPAGYAMHRRTASAAASPLHIVRTMYNGPSLVIARGWLPVQPFHACLLLVT
jgi:hypothetical protein